VHEIVRFARGEGILCQGRGSAANSTCCYVLGITAVDPSKHDLLFERFVSANRNEPPDIDVDFEHERREEVIQHTYERYGRERAAIAGTVIRYRARSAVREVGKVLGLSEDVTGKLAKGSWGPGRDSSLQEVAASEGLDPTDHRLGLALELAEQIQDFPRHLATHVGGFALLRQHHRMELGLAEVPKDCAATYAMLRRADSLGVFQVESRAQMNMLPRLRPERFYDLVIQVAIIRPGPIQGDMVHPYLRRRWGQEEPVYPSPGAGIGHPDELKNVLQRTLGVPLFQEQAMRVAMVAADFSPEEADKLRRAMATFKHTQGVGEYRQRLIGGMVRRGYDPELAERVFQQIEGFGSYGFPESHAASFAHLAYASSWLKCHHPTVFAAALLNSQPMGFYAPAQIVRDASEHGVKIRPLDVNASLWDCSLEAERESAEGYALRLGLRMANGLSAQEGQQIVKARSGGNGSPFASPEEVVRRAGIGRKATEALAQADAFRSLGSSRRAAVWAAQGVENDVPPLLRLAAEQAAVGEPPLLREPAPELPEESDGERVVLDYTATGLTLGQHPLALLRPQLQALGCIDTKGLARLRAGRRLKLAGLVLMRQRPGTAKGVVFVTVEDEYGTANLVVWADVGARDRAALLGARLMLVEARIERETERAEVPIIHLICKSLADRTDLLDGLMHRQAGLPWGDAALGRADEVRRPDPGSRRPVRMPASRDFH
jgi:error-prone DNA polymerase